MDVSLINRAGARPTAAYAADIDVGDADFLLLCTFSGSIGGVDTALFDGVAFTKVFSHTESYNPTDGASIELAFWTLANPSQGSHTLSLSPGTIGSDSYRYELYAVKGISPTNPVAGTNFSSETHSGSAGEIGLEIATTAAQSFGVMIGTIYFNSVGRDYFEPGSGFTEDFDSGQIQSNGNGGEYGEHQIFIGAGTKVFSGHGNFTASGGGAPGDKEIEVAILLNGTGGGGAAGNFFPLF